MDAKTNIKARLPSRHVTEGPARAPHRSYDCAMGLTPERVHDAEVFKRTPYVADLKPGGRFVAKDMVEVGGIPFLMNTLLDRGDLHGECITVTGRTIAETMKTVKWNPDKDVVRPAGQPITVNGAITHPVAPHETQCHAHA